MIELLVTIAVAAILMSLAAPSFQSLIASNRLSSKTNELVTTLNLARSEAIRKGKRVVVCRSADGANCAASGDWSSGWLVYEDTNSNGSKDSGEDQLASYVAGSTNPKVSGDTNLATRVTFSPDGRAQQAGTLRVCSTSPALGDDRRTRDITVTTVGRLSTSATTGVNSACADPS